MACGTPVVAAAVGGHRALIDDGRTGFLVDDRDPASFAKRIDELLGDPSLRSGMGAAAAVESTRYTWSATAGRLRRLYADLSAHQLVECA
jgi:D-inositol-3-phosphate glycosyltransferase